MNTETDWQARAEKAELELARMQAQLPVTYYAAAPLADRVRNMVEHWRKLVPLAEELERVQAQAAALLDVVTNCGFDWSNRHVGLLRKAAEARDPDTISPAELRAKAEIYDYAAQDLRYAINKVMSGPIPRLIPAEKLAPIVAALSELHSRSDYAAHDAGGLFIVAWRDAGIALAAAKALMEDKK